ncbi:hypothetical protein [Ahrensia sp. R2A130]|uniref:hypothetical protein n=1 Tax=Ahrensia sp. R2A130 TaxID=744979 RepID=UPI0001E0F862|nr:hypothetical protein [Ahrensia sp. R2A130]EFL89473.1 conserved hypothetical protein [Ahrensia sp. R2A130]
MSNTAVETLIDPVAPKLALSVVDRLVALLDAESALIEAGETGGLADTTLAKSRMLLEINRLSTGHNDHGNSGNDQAVPTRAEIVGLKRSLERNERALAAQLSAARTVSDMVTNALREQQSDTTYSNRPKPSSQTTGYGRAFGV